MELIHFKPESDLTFRSVASYRAKLYALLAKDFGDKFCLDLSEVNYCDSAGLALLIEAKKLCDQKNKIFEVAGLSSETLSLAEFCGVKSILEPLPIR